MFKQLISLVFLAAFATQTFQKSFIVFDYFTNTGKYAKNCENKIMPAMHCNGKCQMVKKLKQEDKKDEQNPERKAENKNEFVKSSELFYPASGFSPSDLQIKFPSISFSKAVKMPRSLLRPPIC